jgi:hypothetical protein
MIERLAETGLRPEEWFAGVETAFGADTHATLVAEALYDQVQEGAGSTEPLTYNEIADLGSLRVNAPLDEPRVPVGVVACAVEELELAGWLVRGHLPNVYTLTVPARIAVA